MSGSAFLQLVAAAEATLKAVPELASVPVHRNRVRAIARDEAIAVTVRLVGSRRFTDGPLGAQDWETTLDVEISARGVSGQDPALAVDALLQVAWPALVGQPTSWPGVTDVDSDPALQWEFDAADTPLALATLRLVVRHRTTVQTLTPWS